MSEGRAIGALAIALFSNYLATWVLQSLLIPVIYLLAIVENYARCIERVPRFVSRFRDG